MTAMLQQKNHIVQLRHWIIPTAKSAKLNTLEGLDDGFLHWQEVTMSGEAPADEITEYTKASLDTSCIASQRNEF